MNDAARLALRLHALIGIVAIGCTRADPQNEQPKPDPTTTPVTTTTTTTVATTTPTTDPTPTTAPTPTGPPDVPHFGCPSTPWCGTSAQAKTVAAKDATPTMGCPSSLTNESGKSTFGGTYWYWGNFDDQGTKDARAKGTPGACCYQLSHPCGGGRPLLDDGAAIVATTRQGHAWEDEAIARAPIDPSPVERQALGQRWLRDALTEQASIASFARASMELMAIGAPPELVEACHRAALDEVRHARLCFALASRYLQREIDPGPMPMPSPRACSVVDVAKSTFVEGCVGETISALAAAREAETSSDPIVRDALRTMALDEESHAALAYRTIAHCIAAGGREVVDALRAMIDGRDERAMDATARDAWREVIVPTTVALLSSAC